MLRFLPWTLYQKRSLSTRKQQGISPWRCRSIFGLVQRTAIARFSSLELPHHAGQTTKIDKFPKLLEAKCDFREAVDANFQHFPRWEKANRQLHAPSPALSFQKLRKLVNNWTSGCTKANRRVHPETRFSPEARKGCGTKPAPHPSIMHAGAANLLLVALPACARNAIPYACSSANDHVRARQTCVTRVRSG